MDNFILLLVFFIQKLNKVLCDLESEGGGWTIIQRRGHSLPPSQRRVDFYRNWTDYEMGFGSLEQDFWLGKKN
jgi:hypothetical protein